MIVATLLCVCLFSRPHLDLAHLFTSVLWWVDVDAFPAGLVLPRQIAILGSKFHPRPSKVFFSFVKQLLQITLNRPKFCSCHWLPFFVMQQLLSSLTSLNSIRISGCSPSKDIIPEFLQFKRYILHTELKLTHTITMSGVAGASYILCCPRE